MSSTTWQSYEEVAQHLLNQFAEHFNLGRVEGKQKIQGTSGAKWEIDAKGIKDNGTGFLIIECRRHTDRRIEQGYVGRVAFSIQDTRAQGGIIVSPLGFQAGAKKVAKSSNIAQVILRPQSTTKEYILEFLGRIFAGLSDKVDVTENLTIRIHSPEGDDSFSV